MFSWTIKKKREEEAVVRGVLAVKTFFLYSDVMDAKKREEEAVEVVENASAFF